MAVDNVVPSAEPNKASRDTKSSPSGWRRGLYMLVFFVLFSLGQSVLTVIALFQFFSLVISGKTNTNLAGFGKTLGLWMKGTAEYQTCATDKKPFPWADWPKAMGE